MRGVDFDLYAGKTLGIVGESGSGKSVASMAIMGLHPTTADITGSITYNGTELLGLSDKEMCQYRGKHISMIFQDPLTSLNPTMKIGLQVCEPLRVHEACRRGKPSNAPSRSSSASVCLVPRWSSTTHPHQLSGGMRQRVMIAMALVCKPRILIADEPTTALDVTTQMQILDLIDELRDEYQMGVILITHDLGVVAGHTDRVAVMYAGRIVETAPTKTTVYRAEAPLYEFAHGCSAPSVPWPPGTKLFSIPGAPRR